MEAYRGKFKSTTSVSGIVCKVFGEQDLPLRGWKKIQAFEARHIWVSVPALPLALGHWKSYLTSEPQFLYLEKMGRVTTYLGMGGCKR